MTKLDWLQRCAKRYIQKAGMTQDRANELAIACFDAQEYDDGFHELSNYNPESCADDDMDEWGRNV